MDYSVLDTEHFLIQSYQLNKVHIVQCVDFSRIVIFRLVQRSIDGTILAVIQEQRQLISFPLAAGCVYLQLVAELTLKDGRLEG